VSALNGRNPAFTILTGIRARATIDQLLAGASLILCRISNSKTQLEVSGDTYIKTQGLQAAPRRGIAAVGLLDFALRPLPVVLGTFHLPSGPPLFDA